MPLLRQPGPLPRSLAPWNCPAGSRPRPTLDFHLPAQWPGRCAAMGHLDPMKPSPPAAAADPVLLFIAVAWLAAEALAFLMRCSKPRGPWRQCPSSQ